MIQSGDFQFNNGDGERLISADAGICMLGSRLSLPWYCLGLFPKPSSDCTFRVRVPSASYRRSRMSSRNYRFTSRKHQLQN